MLVNLNWVGGTRQAVAWGVAVPGPNPDKVANALARVRPPVIDGGPVEIRRERFPGLYTVRTPLVWLGSLAAREELFTVLRQTAAQIAEAVRSAKATLLPTAIALGKGEDVVLGGDIHELEVLDLAEQEVLCNLLRRHIAVLIAYAGRGIVGPDRPADRVGSRWLSESAEHVPTRYLRSASPRHLELVQAELRRSGIWRLDQMDISPQQRTDGTRTVLVRCLDAQPSVALTRTFAVLLGALAAQARCLVRDGYREDEHDQQLLERDRARAVAGGPRAVLHAAGPGGLRAPDVLRELLGSLRTALDGLEVTAAELGPLLAAVDLPTLEVPFRRVDDLLCRWAAEGSDGLAARLAPERWCDGRAGGVVLQDLYARYRGRVELVIDSWEAELGLARGVRPLAQQLGEPG